MARACFWTLVGGLFLGTACLASFSWLVWEPEDHPPRPERFYEVDQGRERDRLEQLENQRKDLFGRDEKRKRLAQDVIDRRVTLRQAAASLHDLESGGVSAIHYAYLTQQLYPGNTVEESLCRKVISIVKEVLEKDPDSRDRVLARLQAELEEEPESPRSLPLPMIQTPTRVHE
jgi:hypothetical protein